MARAAHLVVLLHDVGKLSRGWQAWVQRYQAAIGRPVLKGAYAHTDADPSNPLHQEQQTAMGRRPSHAVEGAVAVAPLLAAALETCEPAFSAAFTAIARHHGAFTRQGSPYRLVTGARQAVSETLAFLPEPHLTGLDADALWDQQDPSQATIQELIANPAHDSAYLAYILLARALRRADQMGTGAGTADV